MIHWFSSLAYNEVVDRKTREPVAPGEEGEYVITPFRREGSPLVRFLSADKVKYLPHNACVCGRPFDGMEAGTISRWDDMMKIKGVNIWPSGVDGIIFDSSEVVEYQGRVFIDKRGGEDILITMEFKKDVSSATKGELMPRLSRELQDKVGLKASLIEAVEPLPKFEFKTRRWTDERLKGREEVVKYLSR